MDPKGMDVAGTVKRLMEANLEYYRGVGRLTADYLGILGRLWGDLGRPGDVSQPRPPAAPAPPAGNVRTNPALVLEGRTGEEAQGVFVVTNDLGREVSATVMTSAFVDPQGGEIHPRLRTDPEIVILKPGERTFVTIAAEISDDLAPGVTYRGGMTVPGLAETQVPVVLRRLEPAAPAPPRKAATRRGGAAAAKTKKAKATRNPAKRPAAPARKKSG